jgi:hypothetical protein
VVEDLRRLLLKELRAALDRDTKEAIVRRTLESRKDIGRTRREALEAVVRTLGIPGFRSPENAPIPLVAKELTKVVDHSDVVLGILIDAWVDAVPDLAGMAAVMVADRLGAIRELAESVTEQPELGDTVGAAAGRLVDESRCAPGEARAIVCALLLRSLESEAGGEAERQAAHCASAQDVAAGSGANASLWDEFLERLRALPAEAREWESLSDFLDVVQRLAAEKALEREARSNFETAVKRLQEECGDALRYFGMNKVAEWAWEKVPTGKRSELTREVDRLRDALLQHSKLRMLPAATLVEERERREQLSALEQQVEEMFRRIKETLGSAPQGVSVSPEEAGESEGTLSESECKTDETNTEQEEGLSVSDDAHGERHPGVSPEVEVQTDYGGAPLAETNMVATVSAQEVVAFPTEVEIGISLPQTVVPSVPESTGWEELFLQLIRVDDLSGAYWLCRSLEARGHLPPVPSWLVEVVQAARWLEIDNPSFVGDLSRIARHHQPGSSDIEEVLALAAALRPAVIAPATGMLAWLRTPGCCSELNSLVEAVRDFAHLGKSVRRVDLQGVAGAEQYEQQIKAVVEAATRWLEEAPRRRAKTARATNVWMRMVGKDSELRAILQWVASDARGQLAQARDLVSKWMDRKFLEEGMAEIDREIIGRRVSPIVGDARDQVIRNAREACELAMRWCEMVGRQDESDTKKQEWLKHRVAALRNGVQASLPIIQTLVSKTASGDGSQQVATAILCLARSCGQLCSDLGLAGPPSIACSAAEWSWLTVGVDELEGAMARRLLLLPEIDFDADGKPTLESMIADVLPESIGRNTSLSRTIERWLEKKDYRFIGTLLPAVQDEEERATLTQHYEEELNGARAALEEALLRTRDEIEQAVVDGILSAEERTALSARLQNVDPATALNFPLEHARLEGIRASVLEARRARLEELGKEWADLEKRLATYPGDPNEKARTIEAVRGALERGDTRVLEEFIAQLTQIMDSGLSITESLSESREDRDVLERFLEAFPRLTELLEEQGLSALSEAVRHGRSWAGLPLAKLPRNVREETLAAIEGWRKLKQGTPRSANNQLHIASILRYLGFNIGARAADTVTVQDTDEHMLYARVAMSAGGRSPVPQFGSQQQGEYDVVCVWERPSVDILTGWMRDRRLQNKNNIIIYLGRMSLRHRRLMRQVAGDRGLAMIVLDEVLFAFLAGEWRERLPSFFRCALPFAVVNPYTPFRAGDVPPEMFFGRREMARELQLAEGSCIVYGGRQLGKSALLRHVQREFHQPERDQFAWVEDIKLVGSPTSDQQPEMIWVKLRDIFKALGLISSRTTTTKPEAIAAHMRETLLASPRRRVLVLLDEADNFLDADAANNFKVVDELRILMGSVQRQLKIVLAGLHNVQRFQGRGNQPLAHFGSPLCVGPLEPRAAQQLIEEPLAALGYRFADSSAVLSILSYTNYHPGLIQLFCYELLNRLNTRSLEGPPYPITRGDVEAIYRNIEVRKRIAERFDWTLALDRRYQAIAWSVILDQQGKRDGFSQTYTPLELLNLARQWWPQGFEGTDIDQLRGLLDEMCGLGVLVRDSQGHYRLRSPNLVRLIEDVETNLLSLSYKEPDVKRFDADSYHAPLNEEGQYSPLTHAQETSLNQPRFGVGIVFGSDALGLAGLNEAFTRFVPEELIASSRAALIGMPAGIVSGDQMEAWLEECLGANDKCERLVVWLRVAGADLAGVVGAALRFTQQYGKRQRQWMRILFILDPEHTWRWLGLPKSDRLFLENQVDVATYLRRWNLRSVSQRLAQRDKIHSEEVCQEVLQATGGWPYLLDELFRRCGLHDDPRPYASELRQELATSGSPLSLGFWKALGLDAHRNVLRMLEFILKEREIPVDLAEPWHLAELIGPADAQLATEEVEATLLYLRYMGTIETTRDGSLRVEPVIAGMLRQS